MNLDKYDPPYGKKHPTVKTIPERLMSDPVHRWRANTGIELIHKEPTNEELLRIISNWKLMSDEQKRRSDKKSISIYGVDNTSHAKELLGQIKLGGVDMPFESKAQQRWMFAKHPKMAKRWAKHTPDIKDLPEHVEREKQAFWDKLAATVQRRVLSSHPR